MKVFFIVPYPSEGASNRLRVEQYLPYLSQGGIEFKVRPFFSKSFYKILYRKGCYIKKFSYFIISSLNRIFDLFRILKYDLVFIHREAFPIGPAFFEYLVYKIGKPIIFDFDDAIYLSSTSRSNRFMAVFKVPRKVGKVIRFSKHIIAGNDYLKEFALKYNKNVTVIPTCTDTGEYKVETRVTNGKEVVIGWIGSESTKEFLDALRGVFKVIAGKYPNIRFEIVGADYKIDGFPFLNCKKWSLETERNDLRKFDIGIMPMPDNEWTKGKCGFKAILYMSMGIPTVCSAVGVNTKIIKDGVNGFLANSDKEWIEKLSLLIEDSALRFRMGMAGRHTVEEEYSLKVNAPSFLEVLEKAYGGNIS